MSYSIVSKPEKLKQRVDEVNPIDAQSTVKTLIAKLKKYDSLYALCAPQVGIQERVIVLKFANNTFKEFINPRIFKAEEYHLVREKDISFPDKEFICPRPGKVFIEYQAQNAKPESNVLKNGSAEIFDRMMNYLDGITLEDYGLEVIPEFDEASKEDQQEVIDMYLNSLKTRTEELNKSIENDKDAKQLVDAINFMASVEVGKTKLKPIDKLKDEND